MMKYIQLAFGMHLFGTSIALNYYRLSLEPVWWVNELGVIFFVIFLAVGMFFIKDAIDKIL